MELYFMKHQWQSKSNPNNYWKQSTSPMFLRHIALVFKKNVWGIRICKHELFYEKIYWN